jgi:hypothetical protein
VEVGASGSRELATARALWEAGRLETRPEELRAAIADADPATLVTLALDHGLSAMLWRALGASACRDQLGADGEALGRESDLRRVEGLLLLPHAVELSITPLVSAGLEPVVFKGPSLASRYPEPGLRSMVDLDVILPAAEHAAAVAVLQDAGWEIVSSADRDHYETLLLHPLVPSLFVELHRGLDTWFQRSAEMDIEELWARRVPTDCLGTPAFGLSPEVEFVALAAHAGKPFHTFSRLIWVVDLTVVAKAGLDWARVGRLARDWRCQTMLAVGLRQAGRLGLDAPPELTVIDGSALRQRVLSPLFDVSWPLVAAEAGNHNRLRYALADRWTRRVVLFAGLPAPAPLRTWPRRYAEDLLRGIRRSWKLSRGELPRRVP